MTIAVDFASKEALRNGAVVTIRTMRPVDRDKIAAAVGQLDRESVYTRLFTHKKELTDAGLDRIMTIDPDRELALLATVGAGAEEIVIGSGRYVASDARGSDRAAEVAFVVEEDYRGLGIASRLFAHLADFARSQGISVFEADVLAGNKSMLTVFARSGLPMQQRRDGGVVHITLSLGPGPGPTAPIPDRSAPSD